MKFAEPIWLVAGFVVIAALVYIYRVLDRRQRAALAEFASNHLLAKLTASFSPGRRLLKRGLFLAALACIFVALARPQWGYHWVDQKERGIDLIFAIDTSKSMLTQDVNPSRLERAKMAITDFVRNLDGDRVGLIAFAGEAFLQAPLTLDYDAFQDSLDAIDVNTIPRGGTDISSAIQEAQAAFAHNTQNKKILILVTDGEDLQGQGIDAARAAAKDGLVIYTVGVGTASGGLIPVPNADGGTDFLKDPATGEYVKSHLDENTLTQIAEATGGMYQPLGQQGQGLGVIYDKALASLPKHDIASRRTRVYEERFQWPLAAGIGLLFASLLIGTRRRTPAEGGKKKAKTSKPVRATQAATAVALAMLAVPTLVHASAQSAESAFKKGDYNKAEKQYEDAAAQHPDDAALQYDLGASAYKTGEFDTALPAFQKALSTDDPALQQQAFYNIGNTQYRIGQKTEKASPQDTIKQWQGAVQSYDAALKLKPDDADAKFNRDYVEKKLEKLQKQQKQDQKKDQQQNQQNKQDQNQQPQQDQQNQQNQQNQNQQQPPSSQGSQGNQQQQQQNGQSQAQNGGQPKNQNGQQQQQTAGNQNQNPDKNQSGQQQQTAGGQGQQQNNQQQQTAGNQNQDQNKGQNGQQQQQTAGNQPQNQNPQQNGNGGDQQQEQTAQNDAKGGGATGQAAAAADKDKNSSDQADAALPGAELTKEQAKDLLNSLKGEEHILPVAQDTRSAHPQDQQVLKDW
jgi:Ca-activated chloride channel family protein